MTVPRDTSKFPPKVTHYSDDPTQWPWPYNPCHSHVLGWDRFTDAWPLVSCDRCLEQRPTPNNIGEAADMTDREPIADLYVCWNCNDHAVQVDVGVEPPKFHDVCGYGPLQWSGQLFDGVRWARTYELRATRVEQEHRARRNTDMEKTRERIPFELIDPNPWQPRLEYDLSGLLDLAASIYEVDVLQTPLARRTSSGRVQAAFGHRRIISCWMLHENGLYRPGVDMDIADLTDDQMAVIALTENERRRDLSQLEVVRAHRRAIDETGLTVQSLADQLGMNRPTLANNLRVLNLPDFVLEHVESGDLKLNVARAFLVLQNADHAHTDDMRVVIRRIVHDYRVEHVGALPTWTRPHREPVKSDLRPGSASPMICMN